mmetsp:Transcript_74733/g.194597  ORF Transcript_74733/g.194597 Transcript_74733/m.194597 type:complete len:80 (+) Transcript_74733:491-730(+)
MLLFGLRWAGRTGRPAQDPESRLSLVMKMRYKKNVLLCELLQDGSLCVRGSLPRWSLSTFLFSIGTYFIAAIPQTEHPG